jgi:hypothetical protein
MIFNFVRHFKWINFKHYSGFDEKALSDHSTDLYFFEYDFHGHGSTS